MKKERRARCSTAEGAEQVLCVCVCVCCLCAFELNICKQVCVHAELYAYCVWYSMFLCTHINRCQSNPMFSFHLSSKTSSSPSKTRGKLSFLFRLTPPEKLFIAFLHWQPISLDGPRRKRRHSGREDADGGENTP